MSTIRMTPFQRAGYTEDTKFKVLENGINLRVGDIVTLAYDYGTSWPYFTAEDGRTEDMLLPKMKSGRENQLEVYEDNTNTPSIKDKILQIERMLSELKQLVEEESK